jgi:AcrR family transcriptional regulator
MKQRLPLSRAAIVAAAVAVADRDGLDRVSMRRLGQHLGVEAMSLYNHVPNKAALLDAMVDEALDAIPVPTDPDWRRGLRGRCLAQRQVFHDHRWALGVVDSRGAPGPATLRRHDATLGYLRGTGFSTRAAGHAYALLDAYVMGFVLREQEVPFDAANEFEVGLDLLLDSLATLVTPGPRTGTGSRRGAARSTPTP